MKTVIQYRNYSPEAGRVLVIQTESDPPYIWCSHQRLDDVARSVLSDTNMLVIRADQARRLFDFRKVDRP